MNDTETFLIETVSFDDEDVDGNATTAKRMLMDMLEARFLEDDKNQKQKSEYKEMKKNVTVKNKTNENDEKDTKGARQERVTKQNRTNKSEDKKEKL